MMAVSAKFTNAGIKRRNIATFPENDRKVAPQPKRVTAEDLRIMNEAGARSRLARNGCPDWIVDLVIDIAGKREVTLRDVLTAMLDEAVRPARMEIIYRVRERDPELPVARMARYFGWDRKTIDKALKRYPEISGEPPLPPTSRASRSGEKAGA